MWFEKHHEALGHETGAKKDQNIIPHYPQTKNIKINNLTKTYISNLSNLKMFVSGFGVKELYVHWKWIVVWLESNCITLVFIIRIIHRSYMFLSRSRWFIFCICMAERTIA